MQITVITLSYPAPLEICQFNSIYSVALYSLSFIHIQWENFKMTGSKEHVHLCMSIKHFQWSSLNFKDYFSNFMFWKHEEKKVEWMRAFFRKFTGRINSSSPFVIFCPSNTVCQIYYYSAGARMVYMSPATITWRAFFLHWISFCLYYY